MKLVISRRLAAVALWGSLLTLLGAAAAAAHPLGNFTINHLARIDARDGRLRVHYVLDIAEIPTFQIMHAAGPWTPDRARDWEASEAQLVAANLSIRSNGSPVRLQLERTASHLRPGAGGLPILYWTGDFAAAVPPNASVAVRDLVYADRRIGWKDIILPGIVDPTDELRSYPSALIGSPRQNDAALFEIRNGRIIQARVSGDAAPVWSTVSILRSSALSELVTRSGQTPLWILLTILAAFGLGALHALEPGHGKALLAFTLVGARATFSQAIVLAASLTFAHTIAVLLLGLLLFVAAGFATEQLFTWITLISGLAILLIGARALIAAARRVVHAREHAHTHAHEHAHAHGHAIPGSEPLRFRSAVIAAMSGGIAPCPAAIVVLLAAVHLHRVGYGLLLIVVFSLGLATILSGLGMAVVHGAAWLSRRSAFASISRFAPFFTAGVISIIGAGMLSQGISEAGAPLALPLLVALTVAGIAISSLLPPHHPTRSTPSKLAIKETS